MEIYCAELDNVETKNTSISKSKQNNMKKICEDLTRLDQKEMPAFDRFETLIPDDMLGDAISVMDFINNFASEISEYVVDFHEINFYELTRAFTIQELDGPLSEILSMLLKAVFALQEIQHKKRKILYSCWNTTSELAISAARTHNKVRKFFYCAITGLPINEDTSLVISEILRLHFLTSGAVVDQNSESYYINSRCGYTTAEDPGLQLRIDHPHILSSLRFQTVFELPMRDILHIALCLINQISTYTNIIKYIDKQRTLMYEKKKMILHKMKEIEPEPSKNNQTIDCLRRPTMANMDFFTEILNDSICLGMDRAYRKYYIFKSICGILVEHSIESNICVDFKNNFERKPISKINNMMMCPGKNRHEECTVHNNRHPNYQKWSYLHQESTITALINSLNPLGERESQLLEHLNIFLPAIIWRTKYKFQLFNTENDFTQFNASLVKATNTKYKNAVAVKDLDGIIYYKALDKAIELYELVASQKRRNDPFLLQWRNNLFNGIYDWKLKKLTAIPLECKEDVYDSFETNLIQSSWGQNFHTDTRLGCLKSNLAQLLEYTDLSKVGNKVSEWRKSFINLKSYSQLVLHINVMLKWLRKY